MDSAQIFACHRDRLLALAYRLTGSVFESEDIVQEAYIRWHHTLKKSTLKKSTLEKRTLQNSAQEPSPREIETPRAWLTTVTTRLSLDYLKSARCQRQSYIGPWLPEPLIANQQQPDNMHALDQSVTMAFMVLLDRLSPAQRAAYILHDLLGYAFDDIAEILGVSSASCRKLASRSREKINAGAEHEPVPAAQHQQLIEAFFLAVRDADHRALLSLLTDDVIFHSDGGGKAAAAPHILKGKEEVLAWMKKVLIPALGQWQTLPGKRTLVCFNGSPGIVLWQEGKVISAFSISLAKSGIRQIYALRNPDKLQLFSRAAG
ncbi:sigma-70 family RNA polymerase sigma factor [Thalassomonas viridans]|uniref:Sigma-70 family RNA polymerase sigma factor n=1 Tax=Thalassomonas viridans TaxID=137584 RepID=A0AAF0CAS5_9GAMM|nr:sigma-70 family RNA polymerase sigma factor [Thalassomonas viridans]WDE07198.1 sigma-70 family RNA polymerase sigma factor [Thalassomonas viridans]